MASSCGWPVGLSGRHALSDVWYMIAVMGSLAFFNRIRFRIFLKLRSGSYITTTFNLFSKLWKAWATSLYMKNSLVPVTRNVNFFWIFCISDYNGRCFNKLRVSGLVDPPPPPLWNALTRRGILLSTQRLEQNLLLQNAAFIRFNAVYPWQVSLVFANFLSITEILVLVLIVR